MEKTKLTLPLQCPDHEMAVGMLNVDLKAQKMGYCFECIAENRGDVTILQTLKTAAEYLKDSSSFYEKCRQRVSQTGEPPAEYAEELSKKGERLEKLSKHIDEEKDKLSLPQMDQAQVKNSICIKCPDHESHVIGMLNVYSHAKKIGYCYECIAESDEDGLIVKSFKTLPGYLKESSMFYEKRRQRAKNAGNPPAEFLEELSKKGERLEKYSKHIDEEKHKVKKRFEETRKNVMEIIEEKEKEYIGLLDKEISSLSEGYQQFEKLLTIGWPKASDIDAMNPGLDVLKQRMAKIENIDQLQAFMAGIKEDVVREKEYCGERIKTDLKDLISCFRMAESSGTKVKSILLNSENVESLMKNFLKDFIRQKAQIENSIASKVEKPPRESEIIDYKQFQVLQSWLPYGVGHGLKRLYRGSVDGLSPEKFHEKCSQKGAKITLIKCRFEKALNSSVIGGFLDRSFPSEESYIQSGQAFLFGFSEQKDPVKCSILKHQHAFFGGPGKGLKFGADNDLYIRDDFKTGSININIEPFSRSYSDPAVLCDGNGSAFVVEEIEVFQVV